MAWCKIGDKLLPLPTKTQRTVEYITVTSLFQITGNSTVCSNIYLDWLIWIKETWTSRSLQWCHNGHDGVSNHQPHHRLLNRLFRRRSKKTSKLRVTGLCAENSPVTGEFFAQMASNAENVSIWWRHHIAGPIFMEIHPPWSPHKWLAMREALLCDDAPCICVAKAKKFTLIASFMGPTWGPMLTPWTLLSGCTFDVAHETVY